MNQCQGCTVRHGQLLWETTDRGVTVERLMSSVMQVSDLFHHLTAKRRVAPLPALSVRVTRTVETMVLKLAKFDRLPQCGRKHGMLVGRGAGENQPRVRSRTVRTVPPGPDRHLPTAGLWSRCRCFTSSVFPLYGTLRLRCHVCTVICTD